MVYFRPLCGDKSSLLATKELIRRPTARDHVAPHVPLRLVTMLRLEKSCTRLNAVWASLTSTLLGIVLNSFGCTVRQYFESFPFPVKDMPALHDSIQKREYVIEACSLDFRCCSCLNGEKAPENGALWL